MKMKNANKYTQSSTIWTGLVLHGAMEYCNHNCSTSDTFNPVQTHHVSKIIYLFSPL